MKKEPYTFYDSLCGLNYFFELDPLVQKVTLQVLTICYKRLPLIRSKRKQHNLLKSNKPKYIDTARSLQRLPDTFVNAVISQTLDIIRKSSEEKETFDEDRQRYLLRQMITHTHFESQAAFTSAWNELEEFVNTQTHQLLPANPS